MEGESKSGIERHAALVCYWGQCRSVMEKEILFLKHLASSCCALLSKSHILICFLSKIFAINHLSSLVKCIFNRVIGRSVGLQKHNSKFYEHYIQV